MQKSFFENWSLSSYLNNSQKKVIFNSIIKAHFNYCPLEWMFCSRTSKNKINKLQEKSVRIVLNDCLSDFNELLETNDICNHQRNTQTLSIEVFKMKDGLVSQIMESMLNRRVNRHNLRNFQEIVTDKNNRLTLPGNASLPISSTLVPFA